MEIRLRLDPEVGGWRVYSPDGHYREFRKLAELPEVVLKVVEDYAAALARLARDQ